jgi:hypothetical protein
MHKKLNIKKNTYENKLKGNHTWKYDISINSDLLSLNKLGSHLSAFTNKLKKTIKIISRKGV